MINKIFKTILVLTICLGISIPTNAAVSVSDGSAFVTKAEFAADLNNLSNRMAQLENSLDAKIDSLVSSYLTRNGIWNGAKQEIANIVMGNIGLETSTSTATAYAHGYDANQAVTSSGRYKMVECDSKTKVIVSSLNKSGLCVLCFKLVNDRKGNAGTSNGLRLVDSSGDPFPLNHFTNISMNFHVLSAADSTSTNTNTCYTYSKIKEWNAATTLVQESTETIYAYFFVSKGDCLLGNTFTVKTHSGSVMSFDNISQGHWYWTPNIIECYIY